MDIDIGIFLLFVICFAICYIAFSKSGKGRTYGLFTRQQWEFVHSKRRHSDKAADFAVCYAEQKLFKIMSKNLLEAAGNKNGKPSDPKAVKSKAKSYIYITKNLLRSARGALGLYMPVPNYLAVWRGRQGGKKYKTSEDALLGLIDFLQKNKARAWYVYYKAGKYVWQPLAKAALDISTPMPDKLRRIYEAYQVLAMHLVIAPSDKLVWETRQCINSYRDLENAGLQNQYSNWRDAPVIDCLSIYGKSQVTVLEMRDMYPVKMQVYSSKKAAAASGRELLPSLQEIFKLAVKEGKSMDKKTQEALDKKLQKDFRAAAQDAAIDKSAKKDKK